MDEERITRRIAVVLAADVVGYSSLMERDEARTFKELQDRRQTILAPEISRCRGRLFKLMGDGMLAEFSSAVDAVECAVSIQKHMEDRNSKQPPEHRIVLRIGIDLGDVIVDGDDLYGDGVNTAARLEQLADPGDKRLWSRVRPSQTEALACI